jgi:hypothetical protein
MSGVGGVGSPEIGVAADENANHLMKRFFTC